MRLTWCRLFDLHKHKVTSKAHGLQFTFATNHKPLTCKVIRLLPPGCYWATQVRCWARRGRSGPLQLPAVALILCWAWWRSPLPPACALRSRPRPGTGSCTHQCGCQLERPFEIAELPDKGQYSEPFPSAVCIADPCFEGWSALSPKKSPACLDRSSEAGTWPVNMFFIVFTSWPRASQGGCSKPNRARLSPGGVSEARGNMHVT